MKKLRTANIILIFASVMLCLTTALLGSVVGMIMSSDKNIIHKTNEENKVINQDLGNILTGTVEINISREFLELGEEEFNYELTQEQKENGFTDIKKNEDGSATYTIKKKDYKKFISELKETTKQGIDELTKDGSFVSIKGITYNDNFSKIVISADKEGFENSFDSMVIFSCGLTSCMYQMFDIDAPGKCAIEIKDVSTGEIFKTTVYPDAMQEN